MAKKVVGKMNGKSSKQQADTAGGGSRIPVMSPSPLRRSGSLRLGNCPPIREHSDFGFKLSRQRSLQSLNSAGPCAFAHDDDDDLESEKSCASGTSTCSDHAHAHFARNGTTFSGRARRYVVHCSPHTAASDEYLTPTQRTNRALRHLRTLLKEAQEELLEKEKEIARLTREVVELRLLKAGDSSETTDAAQTDSPTSGGARSGDACSLSDSGHFEELVGHSSPAKSQPQTPGRSAPPRAHEDEVRELRERHNEQVESLLQRIADANDRYYDLRPKYEECKEQLREAHKINEELKSSNPNSQLLSITELQNSNKELQATQEELINKLNRLEKVNQELEAIRFSHEKLTEEKLALKDKEQDLTNCMEQMKEQEFVATEALTKVSEELEILRMIHIKLAEENASLKCREEELVRICTDKIKSETYEKDNQTDFLDHLSYTSTEAQTEAASEDFEHQHHYDSLDSLRPEIGLRAGASSSEETNRVNNRTGVVRQAESLVTSQNGPQATENGTEGPKLDVSSVLPDLLQKLLVTQEELEDIKHTELVSAENLLSAREAVSLWSLARQINYRRLLETKRQGPNNDAETTLQFLKSAFYYFFTDRENARGHLAAIESILGFDDGEKNNIEKAYLYR